MEALTRFTAATRVRFDVMNKMADEIEARDSELNEKNTAQDADITQRVTYAEYDVQMMELDNKNESQDEAIARKVEQSVYNTKMTALDNKNTSQDTAINSKVAQTAYDSKMTELDNKNTSQDTNINSRVLQTAYDTKMTALDSKNTEQDTAIANKVNNSTFTAAKTTLETKNEEQDSAITEKVKLNGTSTNVNFKRNEIVQDGLVDTKTITSKANFTVFKRITLTGAKYEKLIAFDRTNGGWRLEIDENGYFRIIVVSEIGGLSGYGLLNKKGEKIKSIPLIEKVYGVTHIIDDNGGSIIIMFDGTDYYTAKFSSIEQTDFVVKTIVPTIYWYDRAFNHQEIQHNFFAINSTHIVNKINEYAISTSTHHVQTPSGVTEEERYTELLKTTCKEFTSNGGNIAVDNGIAKQKVLSAKLEGQTVKNYAQTRKVSILESETGWRIKTTRINKSLLLPSSKYYVHIYVFRNTLNGRFLVSQDFKYHADSLFVGQNFINTGFVGYNKFAVTSKSDLSLPESYSGVISQMETMTMTGEIEYAICVTENDVDLSNALKNLIPFGLSSTQATIYNNNLKYSFYATNEDKLAGKVISLPFQTDRITLAENGSAVFEKKHKFYEPTQLKSLNWILQEVRDTTIRFNCSSVEAGITDGQTCICNILPSNAIYGNDLEGVNVLGASKNVLSISVKKNKLDTPDVQGLIKFLDGCYILYETSSTSVITIDKSLVPAILTQATNEFKFGEAVAPTSVTIKAPTTDDIAKSYENIVLLNGHTQTVGTAKPVVNLINTGLVRLQMDLTAPATGMNATLFSLPVELRPITTQKIPVFVNGVCQLATIDKTTGNVNLASVPSASANIYIKTDYRRDI